MKEIKFRVWDKENKKFLKPYREQHIGNWVNTLSINMDGSLSFHEDDGFGGKSVGGESIEKRFEVVLYTGLKDKNGMEIHEGDVVKYEGDMSEEIGDVCFDTDEHGFSINADGSRVVYLVRKISQQYEVIGNVYEHPHLLLEVD